MDHDAFSLMEMEENMIQQLAEGQKCVNSWDFFLHDDLPSIFLEDWVTLFSLQVGYSWQSIRQRGTLYPK
jgi:hypothetical protein